MRNRLQYMYTLAGVQSHLHYKLYNLSYSAHLPHKSHMFVNYYIYIYIYAQRDNISLITHLRRVRSKIWTAPETGSWPRNLNRGRWECCSAGTRWLSPCPACWARAPERERQDPALTYPLLATHCALARQGGWQFWELWGALQRGVKTKRPHILDIKYTKIYRILACMYICRDRLHIYLHCYHLTNSIKLDVGGGWGVGEREKSHFFVLPISLTPIPPVTISFTYFNVFQRHKVLKGSDTITDPILSKLTVTEPWQFLSHHWQQQLSPIVYISVCESLKCGFGRGLSASLYTLLLSDRTFFPPSSVSPKANISCISHFSSTAELKDLMRRQEIFVPYPFHYPWGLGDT